MFSLRTNQLLELPPPWAQWIVFVNSSSPKTYAFEPVESSGFEQRQRLQGTTAFGQVRGAWGAPKLSEIKTLEHAPCGENQR